MQRIVCLSLALLGLAACGGRVESDLDRPLPDIQKEAADMDAGELEAVIKEYQEYLKQEGEKFKDKGADSVADVMDAAGELAKVSERMQVYVMELAKRKR